MPSLLNKLLICILLNTIWEYEIIKKKMYREMVQIYKFSQYFIETIKVSVQLFVIITPVQFPASENAWSRKCRDRNYVRIVRISRSDLRRIDLGNFPQDS